MASLGGWDKLMETLRRRLEEQRKRHQGGSKWIGTAGTSPFGAYGYNPEGVRIGQDGSRHRRAVKVWDRREYRDFDDTRALGTRGFKVALRRLRRFAREGAAEELDLDGTIRSTARNAGLLDVRMVPERRNAVKVLLFLDAGGSMNDHVRVCEELFSAARGEFRHLGAFLLPQLPLRIGVAGQPPPARPAHPHRRGAAHLWPRLQGRLRRGRDDEPLRDRLPRRQRRALERGIRRGVDGARARALRARDLAQPGAPYGAGRPPLRSGSCASSWTAGCSPSPRRASSAGSGRSGEGGGTMRRPARDGTVGACSAGGSTSGCSKRRPVPAAVS